MDVLAEEFGNLTPEQLAAPISTVEVRAGHAESGRGRERPREALPPEEGGGRRLLRMLRTKERVSSGAGRRVHVDGPSAEEPGRRAHSLPGAGVPFGVRVCQSGGWGPFSVCVSGQDWPSRPPGGT